MKRLIHKNYGVHNFSRFFKIKQKQQKTDSKICLKFKMKGNIMYTLIYIMKGKVYV